MTAEFPRTTWARASRDYDEAFKHAPISEIVNAIAKASIVTDANVMAIRTGETTEALIICLRSMSMSPHFDVPSHLREFAETLSKRVRREVARARAEGFGEDFIFGARRGGTA
jgi:hypothetical protein